MIPEILAIAQKEWRELFRQDADGKGLAIRLALLGFAALSLAGVAGPGFGASWGTALVISLLAGLSIISVVADAVAGERERHTLETLLASRVSDLGLLLGKYLAYVLYGFATGLTVLAVGLVIASLRHLGSPLLEVRPLVLSGALGMTLVAVGFTAAIGIHVSLRAPTTKHATQTMGLLFFATAAAATLLAQLEPPPWLAAWLDAITPHEPTPGMVFLAVVQGCVLDGVLLGLAVPRFRRSRLILD